MPRKQVLTVCADANSSIGAGHAVRSLALAQEWQRQGGKALFFGVVEPEWLKAEIVESGIELLQNPVEQELLTPEMFFLKIPILEKGSWISIDGYGYKAELIEPLRSSAFKVLVFDDSGERLSQSADIILNQNLGGEELIYSQADRVLSGLNYALLRQDILHYAFSLRAPQNEDEISILLTLGAGEHTSCMKEVIILLARIAQRAGKHVRLLLIKGMSSIDPDGHLFPSEYLSVEMLKEPSEALSFYNRADIAVAAASSTCWELGYIGTPLFLLQTAENQSLVFRNLIEQGKAQVFCEQFLLEYIAETTFPADRTSRRFVDGLGADRVVDAMLSTLRQRGGKNA